MCIVLQIALGRKIMKRFRTCLAVILLTALVIVPVNAQWDEVIAAYAAGDYATTLKIIKPLAEHGEARAQHNLGVMYGSGQGVLQDYEMAIKWYQMAADQGYASAQYNLGVMYDNGLGVLQDYKMAVKWYQMAADQGRASAQYNLGVMYDNGLGVVQDYKMAHMYFNISAANGNNLSREYRDEISVKMTPQQIAEAQQMAREWIEKNKF